MNQPTIFHVLWEQRTTDFSEWKQLRASFTIKDSAIAYAKSLRESQNIRTIELVQTIPLIEEEDDGPICPICKTGDAMVFHANKQKWFCHHTHAL